ncbi:MAG: ATP-grasp domain-containing protein [Planctomycetes bacterium]|nr:ATP-grasp domain-containing protein [Planctomycetota bacterium]
MKKLRIIALMRDDLPEDIDALDAKEGLPFMTERDVSRTLQELGHDVLRLAIHDDLAVLRDAIIDWKPTIVFNLLEEFCGLGTYLPFIVSYLELMKIPYTGCNPRGLILSDDKALMRTVLRHHRIPMPDFFAVARGKTARRPRRIAFPLIVKSAKDHGSVGISQSSIVQTDEKLRERVEFVHERMESDAIVEEFIDGRELYMPLMGHRRLQALPIWEIFFTNLPEGAPRIATEKVKWDLEYQEKIGLMHGPAESLSRETEQRIENLCKRAYRHLQLSGYARMDLRLTDEGKVFLLEPNPNPDLARSEEFASAAELAGYAYPELIQKILSLGYRYPAGWRG